MKIPDLLRKFAIVGAISTLLVGGVAGTVTFSANAATLTGGTCSEVTLPVALAAGQPTNQTVAATFCTPTSTTANTEIDVLVAGATYGRDYWNWAQNPALYSFAQKDILAGRGVFFYDRLGTGSSTRPNSLSLTVDANAYVLHQIITWVRQQGHNHVNTIGHSLGSVVVTKEAAVYHDTDGVVVTGILHLPGIGLKAPFFATSLYPAALDPKFIGKGYDLGYLTTIPGTRGNDFYDTSAADPQVIAYDEAHKEVSALGEIQSVVELETLPLLNSTRNITAPVLVVMGETDDIFCNLLVNCHSAASISANESPYYSGAASFSVATVPNTGHNLTVHPSANQSFASIDNWLTTH